MKKQILENGNHSEMEFLGTSSALVFLILTLFFHKCLTAYITVVNKCPFTVWPVLSGVDSTVALNTSSFHVFTLPPSWQTGRVWGRTNCTSGESVQNFSCTTGGCGGPDCTDSSSPTQPVTLVELRLNGFNDQDFYDVSLIDGFNLPVEVAPSRRNCSTIGCWADLNKSCPPKQRFFENGDGKVVGCHNTCRGSDPANCGLNDTNSVFRKACPHVYTSPTDDGNALFTCTGGADYNIIFCPPANVRLGTTPQIQPSSPPPFSAQDTPAPPPPPPFSGRSTPSPPQPPPFSAQDTPAPAPLPVTGAKRRRVPIILIVASAAVVLILAVVLFIVHKIKQGARKKKLREWLTLDGHTENRNHNLRQFTYESILSATSNFSLNNKLGEGGFGSVYKGQTSDGQDIAVKVLSQQSGQGLVEFKNELILISKLQHVNLVKLHGFCIHGDDNMIIYDYMPNKSLDFFLFGPSRDVKLNWPQRFNIIEGIAQGLLYLHKYSRLKIIHRDLKPSNILLDKNMNAKISDFGLARVFESNIDEANTNRRVGTFGYMAPEYAMQGMFSVKSDVYSFGVLVLEIVSGRKNNCFHQMEGEGPLNLVEHAWDLCRNDSALRLMDPTLTSSCDVEQLQRCIHIGLLCVENRAVDRPTSEDVILMLKSKVTSLPRPKNPSFIARNHVVEEATKKIVNSKSSVNEVTLSDIGGR